MCLIHWYLNMSCRVKWGMEMSKEFSVPLGIKQGGINSLDFFGVYFDDLSKLLRQLEIGCHMFGLFLALLMFADDIVLMAPTRMALNKLKRTCSQYCTEFCLSFNWKKSKVMIFSTRPDTQPPVADGWAGEEMRVFPLFNSSVTDRPTNQPTNQPTDQQTDGWTKPLIELRVRN